jgi:hypothetical protein
MSVPDKPPEAVFLILPLRGLKTPDGSENPGRTIGTALGKLGAKPKKSISSIGL